MQETTGYKSRLKQIKQTLSSQLEQDIPTILTKVASCKVVCKPRPSPLIIVQKSSARKKMSKTEAILSVPQASYYSHRYAKSPKAHIEKFQPIHIPKKEPAKFQNTLVNNNKSHQIQIRIEQNNKDCIKKLFKKVHKLTEDLAESQKARSLLELELKNRRHLHDKNGESGDLLRRMEVENHKLNLEVENLREKLTYEKLKPSHIIQKFVDKPIEIIKQVPVQKIVQVKVEIPKYIPGPERIVERIVEVPKYIEVQKNTPVPQQQVRQIIKTVPQIIQKPIYIDKPVYIDKIVQKIVEKIVQVPVEVPIEVPIYVNQHNQAVEAELQNTLLRMTSMEQEISSLSFQNQTLRRQNRQLFGNIDVLKRHNQQKNREVEGILRSDYENRRGISIIRQMSGLPSSQFSSTFQQGYSRTAQNFSPSTAF